MEYRVISADTHIDTRWLPKDLWTSRLPTHLRDRAPQVQETEHGPHWFCEGQLWSAYGAYTAAQGSGAQWALESVGLMREGEARPATPALHIEDMDRDGVDVDVIYGPTDSLPVPDMELRRACYSAYNDWLIEFQSYNPQRLVGVGQLSWEDPEFSKQELLRAAKKGIKHFNIAAVHCNPPVYAPEWEPFWDVAEDTGIPIGFHLVVEVRRFSRRRPSEQQEKPYDPFIEALTNSAKTATGYQIIEPVTGLIWRGILDRHPRLKIVMAESGLSWIPNMMESLDVMYRRIQEGRRPANAPEKLPEMLPSKYWARQIWMTFQDDAIGLRCLDALNEDRVMWANDYPHPASTWPRSQEVIERNFKGIPSEARHKILVDNARQLYDL